MRIPSYADTFEVLCLQAADEGRGEILFGSSFPRARTALRPFMLGDVFPSTYLEFPLIGSPFLDVTVLYSHLPAATRIHSEAAAGTEAIIDWFAGIENADEKVSFGFELDTKNPGLPAAAIHFQPRHRLDLVRPFCEAAGEPERAELYLQTNERMPQGWPLSFFGMFRGRPGSPLRVCGYLSIAEANRCVEDPRRLADVFDQIGFTAYNETMLSQATRMMASTPKGFDFQFDVWPDGTLGSTFAIDVQFGIEQPEAVLACFQSGAAARIFSQLEEWGAADGRWHMGGEAAFARALPVELDDGSIARYAFTLIPQWAKIRWTDGTLQPSKLYHLAHAGLI